MRRRLLPFGGVAVVAAAIVAGTLAHSVLSLDGDGGPKRGATADVARALTGFREDRAWERVVSVVRAARHPRSVRQALHAAAAAEAALRAEMTRPRSTHRAQAANLLGVLLVADAQTDPANAERDIGEALDAFRSAAAIDPTAEDAKYNLELVLRLSPGRVHSKNGKGRAHGAGSNPPGGGY
jgi:hypothetical protein